MEAEPCRRPQGGAGNQYKTRENAGGKLRLVLLRRAETKGRAQDNQRNRRGGRRDLRQRAKHRLRQRNPQQQERHADQRAQNHRIFQHVKEEMRIADPPTPEEFQRENAEHVVDRHHDGDHHGRDRDILIPEQVRDQRDPHQHEIAAVNRLDHRAAPFRRLLREADGNEGADVDHRQRAQRERDQSRAEGGRDIRRIKIVKHHDGEEHAEHHAVHALQLHLVQKVEILDHDADEHQAEHRHHRLERDHEVGKINRHKRLILSLIISSKL